MVCIFCKQSCYVLSFFSHGPMQGLGIHGCLLTATLICGVAQKPRKRMIIFLVFRNIILKILTSFSSQCMIPYAPGNTAAMTMQEEFTRTGAVIASKPVKTNILPTFRPIQMNVPWEAGIIWLSWTQ